MQYKYCICCIIFCHRLIWMTGTVLYFFSFLLYYKRIVNVFFLLLSLLLCVQVTTMYFEWVLITFCLHLVLLESGLSLIGTWKWNFNCKFQFFFCSFQKWNYALAIVFLCKIKFIVVLLTFIVSDVYEQNTHQKICMMILDQQT